MNFEIVKLDDLSGCESSIYTFRINKEQDTLFEQFIKENKNSYLSEIKNIVSRLNVIGKKTGGRESYFKIEEGNPGDGVCALFDIPKSKLRLYCIRYGSTLLILGSGGIKPKSIKSLQENEKLTKENFLLRELSQRITERIISKEIEFINDGKELNGNLIFNEDDN